MRLILLISFLCIAYGQGNGKGNGNGNGNGPEFEEPTSVITLGGPSASSTLASSTSSSSSTTEPITTTSSTSSTSSEIPTSTTTTTTTSIITQTAQPSNFKSGFNQYTGLVIAGCIIGAIVILGIMVFIYRKIRGLDDDDFKIVRQEIPEPFDDRLSAPDYGRSSQFGAQQYAVYPTVGRPGLPGFVEKGHVVETPNTVDTNYFGTPELGYHPDYYNQYNTERTAQYSNGYQVTRPQDSMHVGRQY